jgi:hypothetical protein
MSVNCERIILPDAMRAYDLIEAKASSNAFIQGLSGVAGFPFTIAVDAGVVPLIYGRLWGEVRALYRQPPITSEQVTGILPGILQEVLVDVAFDKVLGNLPLIGIYFNAICAKTLTWRLGTLFTMLAARGPEVPETGVVEAIRLIRHVFPQRDMFSFANPERQVFMDLVSGMAATKAEDFERRVRRALEVLGE